MARYSGVQAHTLRAWEQRYNALQPSRSEGNTRYYSGQQLRRLLNLVSLQQAGFKVSEVGPLPDEELFTLLKEQEDRSMEAHPSAFLINQLIGAAANFDESLFDKSFSHALLKFGLVRTFSKVLLPMLNRVGLLWAQEAMPPAQEHFVSNLVRQKLYTAIDAVAAPSQSADKWLLFLPEDEYHDLGLLLSHLLIRQAGHDSVYLGATMPLSSISEAISALKPTRLLLFYTHSDTAENIKTHVDSISRLNRSLLVYVAGHPELLAALKPFKNVRLLPALENLVQELSTTMSK
jgi:DNA-binding transcriptional MerR regulator